MDEKLKIEVRCTAFTDVKKAGGTKFTVFARGDTNALKDQLLRSMGLIGDRGDTIEYRVYLVLEPIK